MEYKLVIYFSDGQFSYIVVTLPGGHKRCTLQQVLDWSEQRGAVYKNTVVIGGGGCSWCPELQPG